MSSKPSKDEQHKMSIEEAAQKYDLVAMFDIIDSLESGEISPAEAARFCRNLKNTIINYNTRLELYEKIEGICKKLQENYEGTIACRDERIEYLEGLTSRQQDVIDSQDKLIMALEERDRYITENYDLPSDIDCISEDDRGEGDEKE